MLQKAKVSDAAGEASSTFESEKAGELAALYLMD
jgi:hypothetical protein